MLRYVTKDTVRRELALAHAAAQLGIHLDEDGIGICPFHTDTRPSFRTWTDDSGIERWHCFPCATGGDVFDLIQRVEGVSFPDSVSRGEAMLAVQPEGVVRAPAQVDTVDLRQEVSAAMSRAAEAENDGWLCVLARIAPDSAPSGPRKAMDRVLRALGWGADDRGRVLVPHYDASGYLTGAKVRSFDGTKWSLPGSAYTQLYGAWLPRRYGGVLITEGESDAAWAMYQRAGVDVRALPSGAAPPRPEWLEYVRQWSDIFLAFDADDAGVKAANAWLDELPEARVCRLPRGLDLREAAPDLRGLLSAAHRRVIAQPGLIVGDEAIVREGKNGLRVVATWHVEPVAHLLPDPLGSRGPALEVRVYRAGQVTNDALGVDELGTASRLRAWAASRSLPLTANDSDVQLLADRLLADAAALPLVFQSERVGGRTAPAAYARRRSVVTPDGSIGGLPWKFVGDGVDGAHVHLGDDGAIDWRWVAALLCMNESGVVLPLVAWLTAAARRNDVRDFPLLMLSGSSGSGKTTLARAACLFFGSSLGVQLGAATPFALLRLLSASTTLPVFVDEWTQRSRRDALEALQGDIPVLYEAGVARRGRSDLSVAEFRLSAPVLVAGEDAFHLDREIERTIVLRTRRAALDPAMLAHVAGQPVWRFGRALYEWLAVKRDLPPMPGHAPDRPTYNRMILEAGWATLVYFMEDQRRNDPNVPDMPDLDLSLLDAEMDPALTANEYEEALAEGAGLRDGSGHRLVWSDKEGRGTWARWRPLVSALEKHTDVELPGRSRAMKQYFAERFELVDTRVQVPMSEDHVRATLVVGFYLGDVA